MALLKPIIRLYPELPIKRLEEDALNIKDIVNNLTIILINAGSPLMLGLYGSWGSGKSSIVNAIRQEVAKLHEDGIVSVSFGAWDHENPDGLLPWLIYAIADNIPQNKSSRQVIKKLKMFAKSAILISSDVLLKSATAGAYGQKDAKDIVCLAEEGAKEDALSKYFDSHLKYKQDFIDIAKKLFKAKITKVIILIDDIDRCHPENIFKFIDNIRRLFSILEATSDENELCGFSILFAVDKEIVELSIKAKYPGMQSDPAEYLTKIFSISFHAPTISIPSMDKFIEEKVKAYFIKESDFVAIETNVATALKNAVTESQGKLTPRHIATFIRHYMASKYILKKTFPLMESNPAHQIPIILMGIVTPANFKEIIMTPKESVSAVIQHLYIYRTTVRDDLREPHAVAFSRYTGKDISKLWLNYQHDSLLKALNAFRDNIYEKYKQLSQPEHDHCIAYDVENALKEANQFISL